jgi:RHS repeat-associated protein
MLDRQARSARFVGPASYPGGAAGNCDENAQRLVTYFYYDNVAFGEVGTMGLPTIVDTWPTNGGPLYRTTTSYDGWGRPVSVDGPRTDVTDVSTMSYDGHGFVARTVDATGHAVRTVTDPARGVVMLTVDENSDAWGLADDKSTVQRYDSLGRLVGVRLPGDPDETIQFGYTVSKTAPSRVERKVQVTPGQWVSSFTYYDGLGRERETQTSSPNGGRLVSARQYDGKGLVVREFANQYLTGTAGSGMWTAGAVFGGQYLTSETRTTYDNLGRVTLTALYGSNSPVTANGVAIQTGTIYDGRWTVTVPSIGSRTRTYTNVLGQVTQMGAENTTWSGWKTTTYWYDVDGNLTSSIDPLNNATVQTFDDLGRLLTRQDPDNGLATMTYNATGQVVSHTDAGGVVVNTAYDALGRPTVIASGATTLESFAYDASGEKGLLNYASSFYNGAELRVDTIGYDARNRPLGYTYTIPSIPGMTDTNGLAGTYTFDQFTYRRDDQLQSLRYPAFDTSLPAETVTTSFNTLGIPVGLAGNVAADVYVSGTTFTNEGWIASRTYDQATAANRVLRSYGWEATTGRLLSMTAAQGATTIQNDTYSYDSVGNLLGSAHDPTGTTSDHRECYRYDGRNRMVGAFTAPLASCPVSPSAGGPSGLAYNQTFTYNEIGNITSGPLGVYTYPVSGSGSIRPHAPTAVGTSTTAVWNADGTQASKTTGGVTRSNTWTPQDRLATVNQGATNIATMVYYPGGQRALLKDAGGVRLYFDGLAERHATTATSIKNTRYYTLAGTMVASRQRTNTGTVTVDFYFGDVRGSTSVSVRRGSTTRQLAWYDPYGKPRGATSITATDRGYIGQYEDTATNLNYLNNRYMDPALGVFLSVDPLVAKTGEPYLYASGNPTTLSDPSGLDPGWAHDTNPCNDNGYYKCGVAKGGPNRGKEVVVGWGRRQILEKARGIGIARCLSVCVGQGPVRDQDDICVDNPDVCGAEPGQSGLSPEEELEILNEISELGLDEFTDISRDPDEIRERGLDWLDWSNDGCSNSPDSVGGTSLLGPCGRHDFEYRNLRALAEFTGDDIFSKHRRADADWRLKNGIQEVCGAGCDWSAYIYGWMVHAYGDGFGNPLPWDGFLPTPWDGWLPWF